MEGRVQLIDRANNLTLAGSEEAGLAFDRFSVGKETKVTVNGAPASIADIKEGDQVRASLSADNRHIHRLDIRSSEAASAGTR